MTAKRRQRRRCAVCGDLVMTYANGTAWRHTAASTGETCAGSNQPTRRSTTAPADVEPDTTTIDTTIPEGPDTMTTTEAPANPALRGTCPACGRDVALRKDGELREHTTTIGGDKCAASGSTIEAARAALPDPTSAADTPPDAAAQADTYDQAIAAGATPAEAAAAAADAALAVTAPEAVAPDLATVDAVDAQGALFHLPADQLAPSPHNPRKNLGDLDELAASIASVGLVEPIIAARNADGTLEVVAGHRRQAAAGSATVPVLVRDLDDAQRAELAIIENLHRKDLDPLEEAHAFDRLTSPEFGYSQSKLAKRLGCSQGHISKRLALLKLPDDLQAEVGRTIRVADAVDLAALPQATALEAVRSAQRKAGGAKAKADDVADHVAAEVRAARADADRAARVRKARKDLKDAGVTVLDEPQYHKSLYDTGWAFLANLPHVADDGSATRTGWTEAEHRDQPCHGAIVWSDGTTNLVCTNPDSHRPEPVDGEEPAPDPGERAAADRAARDEAQAARSAAWSTAARARHDLIARMLKDRLPREAVVDLVAGAYLANFDEDAWQDVDQLLTDVRWALEGKSPATDDDGEPAADDRPTSVIVDQLVYNYGALTVALAFALCDGSLDVRSATRPSMASVDALEAKGAAVLAFLVAHGGYELDDREQAALDAHAEQAAGILEAYGSPAGDEAATGSPAVETAGAVDDWEDTPPPPAADQVKPPKSAR